MRWLLILLLLLPLRLTGATGDVLSGYVGTNGYLLFLKVSSMFTNGTYTFGYRGLGSNNFLTETQALTMTLNSPGFDDNCVSNWTQRSVVGTARYAFPYPDTNQFEFLEGTDVWLQVALSNAVYRSDGNLSLNVRAGFYTTGSTSSLAITGLSITNLSTNWYQLCPANNSRLDAPFALCTNSTQRVGVVAAHWSAQQGRPVRAVKFWATNSAGTILTQIVTSATWDRSFGDQKPVVEYLWDVPLAGFGHSNLVTVNWAAYPWYGDLTSVVSTDDGTWTYFNPNHYSPVTFYNDRLSEFHQTWANVDPVNGSDGTGVAVASASWTTNTAPFRTIKGAFSGIYQTNKLLWNELNCGGGRVFLTNCDATFSGTNMAVGSRPATWATITRMPCVLRSQAIISTNWGTTTSSNLDISDLIKLEDITIGPTPTASSSRIFSAIDYVWIDNCEVNSQMNNTFYYNTNWWFTRCPSLVYLKQGWTASISEPANPAFRGNIFMNTNGGTIESSLFIGNWYSNSTAFVLRDVGNHTSQVFTIWSFNKILMSNWTAADFMNLNPRLQDTGFQGALIAQNEIEGLTDGATYASAPIGGSSLCSNIWNVLVWNNTWVGAKVLWFYDWDTGFTGNTPKLFIHVQGNISECVNIKTDTTVTAAGGRIGNHWCVYGVGWTGNVFPNVMNLGESMNDAKFFGCNSYVVYQNQTNGPGYVQFVNRQAWNGNIGAGRGNYRLQSSSPVWNVPAPWVLPFDLDGNPRGAMDPAGAYVAGNVKKGTFF